MSDETKRKISIANTNPSAATRKRMSKARKGRLQSPETRAKIGDVHRGKVMSAETRAKISAAHLGKKVSKASRRKMSMAKRGVPKPPISEATSVKKKCVLRLASAGTNGELRFNEYDLAKFL